MNARKWTSIFLFIGAYSPLLLILLIKDFDFKSYTWNNFVLSTSILIIALLSVLILIIIVRGQRSSDYKVTISNAKLNSDAYLNYTIPYIISFFGVDTNSLNELAALGLFLILLGYISITSKVVFTNPVMAILGYKIYSCSTTYANKVRDNVIVFSKQDFSDIDAGNFIDIADLKKLSENTFIDLTKTK